MLSGSTELILTVEPSDTTSEVVVPSGIMVGKAVVVPPVLSSSGEGLQLEISPDKAKISKANVAWIFILFKLNTGQIKLEKHTHVFLVFCFNSSYFRNLKKNP